jgi:hypothetical protein
MHSMIVFHVASPCENAVNTPWPRLDRTGLAVALVVPWATVQSEPTQRWT